MRRHLFSLTIVALLVSNCTTQSGKPAQDLSFIDPEQKALPKDGSVALSDRPITDTSLDGKGEVIANNPSSSESSPTTSTAVEREVGNTNGENKSLPTEEHKTPNLVAQPLDPSADVKAGAPKGDSNSLSANVRTLGNGPSLRYIKAKDLNIRSQPNRFSKITGMVRGRDKVQVTIIGGWAKLDEGRWIRSRWLSKTPPKEIMGSENDEDDEQTHKSVKTHHRKQKHKK